MDDNFNFPNNKPQLPNNNSKPNLPGNYKNLNLSSSKNKMSELDPDAFKTPLSINEEKMPVYDSGIFFRSV